MLDQKNVKSEHVSVKGEKHYLNKNGLLDLSNLEISTISEIKGLSKLISLEKLMLNSNLLKTTAGIETCRNLWYLDISHNQLEDLRGVEQLEILNNLIAAHNNIKEIPLINPRITELNLSFNKITEIPNQKFIQEDQEGSYYFSHNEITRVPLGIFNWVSELDLSFNKIKETRFLEKILRYEKIDLRGNPIDQLYLPREAIGFRYGYKYLLLPFENLPENELKKIETFNKSKICRNCFSEIRNTNLNENICPFCQKKF